MKPRAALAGQVLLASLLLALAVPGLVQAAGPKAAAKQHYKKGVTEYNLGHFDKAINEFEQAYGLDPSPILLFNIGQAHRRAGNGDRAVFFLRRYLAEDPNTKDRDLVERWIKEIEDARPAPPALAPTPPPTSVVQSSSPVVPAPTPVTTAPDRPVDRGEPVAWMRPAAWVAGGLGVGALALGVQQTLAYGKAHDDFARLGTCGQNEPNRGGARCSELYDDGGRAKTVAIIGYAAGGAFLVTSGVLFALSAHHGESRVAAVPRCLVLGPAATCRFAF